MQARMIFNPLLFREVIALPRISSLVNLGVAVYGSQVHRGVEGVPWNTGHGRCQQSGVTQGRTARRCNSVTSLILAVVHRGAPAGASHAT